ncbi:hypothetical protein M405DRAFT_826100, partial [Rhizopogon salebrosus TDB-379]
MAGIERRHNIICLLLSLVPSSKVAPPRLSIDLLLYAMILGRVRDSHNDFTVDDGSKFVVLDSTSKNGVSLCMMLFQIGVKTQR